MSTNELRNEIFDIFKQSAFVPMRLEVILSLVKSTRHGVQVGKALREMARMKMADYDGKIWSLTPTGVQAACVQGARSMTLAVTITALDNLLTQIHRIEMDLNDVRASIARTISSA